MDWSSVIFWMAGTVITVLGPIILVHELGHFVFAKLAGVRVEEFGFGFPPRLLTMWRGRGYVDVDGTRVGIQRSLRARLPSGLKKGDHVAVVAQRQRDGSYRLSEITRLAQDGKSIEPVREQTDGELRLRGRVTELEPGTRYSLNVLPMGAFVKMTGEEDPTDPRSLAAQPKRWRLAALVAGPAFNLIAAFLLLVAVFTSGQPTGWLALVAGVGAETPAAEAGLQVDDVVVSAAGQRLTEGAEQFTEIIRAHAEQPLELVVLRGEETLTVTATPGRCSSAEECAEEGVGLGLLGVALGWWPDRASLDRYDLPRALRASAEEYAFVIGEIARLPARLIRGEVSTAEVRPTSIVGASEVLAFALQESVRWQVAFPILRTAALTSLALGITNLLPLPALDGGRLLFVLIEALRGRRIPPEREALVHFVGMAILVALMLLVMIEDIINPILPWSRL